MSTQDKQPDLVAWEVEIDSMTCIVFAATKAKAQWIATKSYWEAYGKNGWPRAKAFRAERHDKSTLRFETVQRAWTEDRVFNSPLAASISPSPTVRLETIGRDEDARPVV